MINFIEYKLNKTLINIFNFHSNYKRCLLNCLLEEDINISDRCNDVKRKIKNKTDKVEKIKLKSTREHFKYNLTNFF